MRAALTRNVIPLIVASALFMSNLDATVLSTSLPAIAADLKLNPIHLKLALTSYLLALAVFIPASGWVADHFGAKHVFRAAMFVFAAGSICCGLSNGLASLVASRVLQGIGGAMMLPVGRLLVWRSVPRAEIIGAAAWLTVPALVGPVIGPVLGGFISTYFDWRWIFWINIPVALLGIALAMRFIPNIRDQEPANFDARGFLLLGSGLSAFLTGITLLGIDFATPSTIVSLILIGTILLAGYVWHALHDDAPLIDLRLLYVPTFRAGLLGGFMFRIGIAATPFLLPLLLQIGFGLTAFDTGLITFATGIGAIFMKTQAAAILRRFGYRRVLVANAVLAACFAATPALFTPSTPAMLMVTVFFVGGFARSLQFTSINTLQYADIPAQKLSRATSFAAVGQELAGAMGVALAALGLELMLRIAGGELTSQAHFPAVFVGIALLSATSVLVFARLPNDAGQSLLKKPDVADAKVPSET